MAPKPKQRNLAKTAAAMAATALLETAIQKAAEDPRVRRKAKAVGKALKKRVKAAGKMISRAIKKRASSRRGLRAGSARR